MATERTESLYFATQLFSRIYGDGNVLSVNQLMQESPRTCQIQAQATNGASRVRRIAPETEINSVYLSTVSEMGANTRVLSPQELQVKSLSNRAKQLNQQAKQLRARHAVEKAQEKLRKTRMAG